MQISEVVMVRKTEMDDKEEEVVAIRLGKFEKICAQREIKPLPEKVVRDSIQLFDLGKLLKVNEEVQLKKL